MSKISKKRKRTDDQEYWILKSREDDDFDFKKSEKLIDPDLEIINESKKKRVKYDQKKYTPRLQRAKAREHSRKIEHKRNEKFDHLCNEFERVLETSDFKRVKKVADQLVKMIQTSKECRHARRIFWKSGTQLSDDMTLEGQILDLFISENLDPELEKRQRMWSMTMVQLVRRDKHFFQNMTPRQKNLDKRNFKLWTAEQAKALFDVLPSVQDREFFLVHILWKQRLQDHAYYFLKSLFFQAFLFQLSTSQLDQFRKRYTSIYESHFDLDDEHFSIFLSYLERGTWTNFPVMILQFLQFIEIDRYDVNCFQDDQLKALQWPFATMLADYSTIHPQNTEFYYKQFYSSRYQYKFEPQFEWTLCCDQYEFHPNKVHVILDTETSLKNMYYQLVGSEEHRCQHDTIQVFSFSLEKQSDIFEIVRYLKTVQKFDKHQDWNPLFQDFEMYCQNLLSNQVKDKGMWRFIRMENCKISEMTKNRHQVFEQVTQIIGISGISNLVLEYVLSIPSP